MVTHSTDPKHLGVCGIVGAGANLTVITLFHVLIYLGINFSGYHENRGGGRQRNQIALAAVEILRLHHYRLSTGGVIEVLPKLWLS